MKKKLITELVEKCKLVREEYINDGHDCWGNLEFYTQKYVYINNKKQNCFDGWYVIHDGENVLEVLTEFMLKIKKQEKKNFDKTGFNTKAEYRAYLKGVKEGKNKLK